MQQQTIKQLNNKQSTNNTMSIKELEPNGVFRNFYSLTQIPRPSKKEAKVPS